MSQNKITLLNECVAQEDSYKIGTHQKIAETLYDIIESGNDAITIGLEGEWGAGKSTVINLLAKIFKKKPNNKTLFFKFDAWNHDGDPLRITFLVNLINTIKSQVSDDEKICMELDKLLIKATGKVKTIKNSSTKTSTRFGKLLAASIMLVPIGSALFSKTYDYNKLSFIPYDIYKEIKSNGITSNLLDCIMSFSFIPTASLFLLMAPVLLVCFWFFFGKEELSTNGADDENGYNHDKWEFISSKSKETTVQDIIEYGDKTSFEFEQLFTELMGIIVGDAKYFSKAVFIIDNMDRVSHEQAKSIWSTLQIFIINDNPNSKPIWFIIPFDESAFMKMWPTEKPDDESKDFKVNSFTEKCFQLVIDVPTPITSNWIDYLIKMSEKAFSKWNDPSLPANFIKQYKDYFIETDHSPTPRSINNTINQVQALKNRFMDEQNITINAITIYSLLRRTNSKQDIKNFILYPHTSTANKSILKRVKAYERELSAILFHMPYSGGLELLLKSEISKIIDSDDEHEHRKLVSLQADYGDAFWHAWDYYYQDLNYKITSENLRKSTSFLHIATTYFLAFKDKEPLSRYINALANSFIQGSSYIFENDDFIHTYKYIDNLNKLDPINDENKINVIKDRTSTFIANYLNITGDLSYKSSQFSLEKSKSLESIKKLLALLKINDITCDKINGIKEFSVWCIQQDFEEIVISEVLPNSLAFKEIARNIFSVNQLDKQTIEKLCGMAELNPKWDGWEEAIDNICAWAKKPIQTKPKKSNIMHADIPRHDLRSIDNSHVFFSLIQILNKKSTDSVKNKVRELISDDIFLSNLDSDFSENINNKCLAELIWPSIETGDYNPKPEILDVINKIYRNDGITGSKEV